MKTPQRVHSHYISLSHAEQVAKEEVYLDYCAQWRGRPVIVTMSCDRYRTSEDRLTDWRIYAREAREMPEDGRPGAPLTETARQRLRTEYQAEAAEWLTTLAYSESRYDAVAYAVRRLFDDARPYFDSPMRDVLRATANLAGELRQSDRQRLNRAAEAYCQFAKVLTSKDA